MTTTPMSNWLENLRDRARFYARHGAVARQDDDFDWRWFGSRLSGRFPATRRKAKQLMHALGIRKTMPICDAWLVENAQSLWSTRSEFNDDVSRLMYDEHLVQKLTDHHRHFFPRLDFEDLLVVLDEEDFRSDELPDSYLGLALKVFRVRRGDDGTLFRVLTTRLQLDLLNRFRQYVPHRNGVFLGPREGDVVFDCGACIGEVSLVFADMVGTAGQVHLFDPLPLHVRFCRLQAALNPHLERSLVVNTVAVGEVSRAADGLASDSDRIDPSALSIDAFPMVSLDDYCAEHGLARVDFIKMDIEGSEGAALQGAAETIRRHKPRLAISAYHKTDDLWVLARRIKELNPDYQLSFGHHSPIQWESVLYAS